MNSKISKLINRIMLTAAASLVSHSTYAVNNTGSQTDAQIGGLDVFNKSKRNVLKDVLQISHNGTTKLIARHTSHSSHRSHSSHSSSSYYGTSRSSSSSSVTSARSYSSPKSYNTYRLGERTIRRGNYGSDVNELVTLLYNKKYINKTKNLKKKKGYYVYDTPIINAYNQFIIDTGYEVKDSLDQEDVLALSELDFINPTLSLGERELLNVGIDYGADVNELIGLLRQIGVAVSDTDLQYKGSFAIYNSYLKGLIIDFQTDQKLNVSGVVNDKTVKKLKKLAKKKK